VHCKWFWNDSSQFWAVSSQNRDRWGKSRERTKELAPSGELANVDKSSDEILSYFALVVNLILSQ